MGNWFYFVKGVPENVMYIVDYQLSSNLKYEAMNRESGWKSMFVSSSAFHKYIIWKKTTTEEMQNDFTWNPSNDKKIIYSIICCIFVVLAFFYYDVKDNGITFVLIIEHEFARDIVNVIFMIFMFLTLAIIAFY
jgi:hypothetical protein